MSPDPGPPPFPYDVRQGDNPQKGKFDGARQSVQSVSWCGTHGASLLIGSRSSIQNSSSNSRSNRDSGFMVATLETEKRNWPFIIMVIVFFSVVFYFNVVLLNWSRPIIKSYILQKDLLYILQFAIKMNITHINIYAYVLIVINAFTLYFVKINNSVINAIVNIFIVLLFLISMFLWYSSIYYFLFEWDSESWEFDRKGMFFIVIFIGLMCCAIFMLIVLDLLIRLFARLFIGKKAEG